MVACDICDKEFKNTQGLRGHKTFVHRNGSPNSAPVTRVASEQPVSLLEERLQQIERVTGLRESDLDFSPSGSEPLTDRLTNITEQVTKLSATVNKLSEEVELSKVTWDVESEEFSKRLTDLQEAHNRQSAVINKHRDTFNTNFDVVGSRIGKVQKMVEDLDEGLSIIRTTQASHSHDGVNLIPKLGNELQDLGTKMVELEATVKSAKKRVPVTPYKFRKLKLTDGTEHTYTLYRGQWGLSRPQKIEDGEYIDLAEPED